MASLGPPMLPINGEHLNSPPLNRHCHLNSTGYECLKGSLFSAFFLNLIAFAKRVKQIVQKQIIINIAVIIAIVRNGNY